ncbi:MAG: hypothetical protein CM1200mP15_06890 [Dehalococcoidia bacterium]|nr:MAG: hypothetical protein CM1200mP15_06890 [Dehalococcoidia bacterium]
MARLGYPAARGCRCVSGRGFKYCSDYWVSNSCQAKLCARRKGDGDRTKCHGIDQISDGRYQVTPDQRVLVDHYVEGKECEVMRYVTGKKVLIPGIMEHIERAGVHSGDSMAIYPGLNLTDEEVDTIVDYTTRIGLENRSGRVNEYSVRYQGGCLPKSQC